MTNSPAGAVSEHLPCVFLGLWTDDVRSDYIYRTDVSRD